MPEKPEKQMIKSYLHHHLQAMMMMNWYQLMSLILDRQEFFSVCKRRDPPWQLGQSKDFTATWDTLRTWSCTRSWRRRKPPKHFLKQPKSTNVSFVRCSNLQSNLPRVAWGTVTPSTSDCRRTPSGFTSLSSMSRARRSRAFQFLCWVWLIPPPSLWQPAWSPPSKPSTSSLAWREVGFDTLVLLAFCKWMTIEAGLPIRSNNGVMTMESILKLALDKPTQGLALWREGTEFFVELSTSSSCSTTRTMAFATRLPWSQPYAMWSLRSTTNRTSEDSQRPSGLWESILEFLEFSWMQTSLLPSSIRVKSWRRSWETNREQPMQSPRQTMMQDFAEHFFDNIKPTCMSMRLDNKCSTGVMLPEEQVQSWSGEALQSLWWLSPARLVPPTTPTGWHMAQLCSEFLANTWDLILTTAMIRIPWREQSRHLKASVDKTNKRKRADVLTEKEAEDIEMPTPSQPVEQPQDYWDVHEDGITWTRVHVQPRQHLFVPRDDPGVPWQSFQPDRLTTIRRPLPYTERTVLRDDWQLPDADRSMPFSWTGSTTFTMRVFATDRAPTTTQVPSSTGNAAVPEEPGDSGARASTDELDRQQSQQEPEPPPPEPEAPTDQHPQPVPEHQRQLYEPPPQGETFAQQRARVDRQETLSMYQIHKGAVRYGPHREPFASDRQQERTPYGRPPETEPDIAEGINTVVDVDVTKTSENTFPPGWSVENGYITLDIDDIQDEWVLYNNTLIRKHYNPRKRLFDPESKECTLPVPIQYLAKNRTTKTPGYVYHDRWHNKKHTDRTNTEWTGQTSFKILPAYRDLAKEYFYNASNGHRSFRGNDGERCHFQEQGQAPKKAAPKGKARKEQLSERHMSLQDRLAFLEAKKAELDSFFKNDVWEADSLSEFPEGRLLKAHFILKWSKWADGSPRAKARLITQGFRDPDALNGMIDTEAPTLSRLSRNFILSVLSNTRWHNFSADISTAFLQGKKHADNRTLWIALPTDARRILGFTTEDKVMRLKKPMYGLCDAPRAWFLEAKDRLTRLGAIQHPLDPCLFLIYDWNAPKEKWVVQEDTNSNEVCRHPPLCGLLGLHVDDLLGGGDNENKSYKEFITNLKSNFQFRTWEEDKTVEYCGATINRISNEHYEVGHQQYLGKQKPISCESLSKNKPDETEVTPRERTLLRGLVGALQWPATQSSPHLQAMISGLAGSINRATVGTLKEANKALRFAKQHSDVTLQYKYLGKPQDLTFLTYCDAAFASRQDLSSQGGYLVLMVHKDVIDGKEGNYQLLDWRSWKLPRVARSGLAAESQAASEAADAMLYASTFWKLIWSPYLALEDPSTPMLKHSPCLVTDAKALYDLLIKQDLQSGGGADKRTTIEVLVTKDKLKCAGAKTKWLSSEIQYADGMTKNSAAMLLAQRLRTHLTRIKPDPNFTAAKKKTPEQRKASQEQYAIKKPERALMATIATTLLAPTVASDSEMSTSQDNMIFFMFFTFLVMFAVHGMMSCTRSLWQALPSWSSMRSSTRTEPSASFHEIQEEMMANETTETGTQTQTRAEDTLVGLRRQVQTLEQLLAEATEQNEMLTKTNRGMREHERTWGSLARRDWMQTSDDPEEARLPHQSWWMLACERPLCPAGDAEPDSHEEALQEVLLRLRGGDTSPWAWAWRFSNGFHRCEFNAVKLSFLGSHVQLSLGLLNRAFLSARLPNVPLGWASTMHRRMATFAAPWKTGSRVWEQTCLQLCYFVWTQLGLDSPTTAPILRGLLKKSSP